MNEYCIKGETRDGKVRMVRRGFVSQRFAEEYPVQMSHWKRVWVEPWTPPLPAKQERRLSHQERVELCFQVILRAAMQGERCPENGSSNVNTGLCRALADAGRIKIEVFARNFRVVTILTGRHGGRKTAPPPYKVSQPKLVISKDGKHIFKRFDSGTRVVVQSSARGTIA
ncbi:MAG: hypothetical protein WBF58_08130 [Xanthobacteraceae bacterium]